MEQNATPRLYRSRQDKVIAGVCGGLGHYFAIDPTLIRLAFVVFTLMSGVGVIAYIIMTIVIPEYPIGENEPPISAMAANQHGIEIVGCVFVGIGALVLANNLGLFHSIQWNLFWPIALIGVGLLLLVSRFRR